MFQVMFQRYRFRVRPPQVDNDSISKSVRDRLVCRFTYSYRYIWTSKPSLGFQFETLEVISFPSRLKFVELEWLIMILIDWKRSPSIISLIYPNAIIEDFSHLTSFTLSRYCGRSVIHFGIFVKSPAVRIMLTNIQKYHFLS